MADDGLGGAVGEAKQSKPSERMLWALHAYFTGPESGSILTRSMWSSSESEIGYLRWAILNGYIKARGGECELTPKGREAVEAYREAHKELQWAPLTGAPPHGPEAKTKPLGDKKRSRRRR